MWMRSRAASLEGGRERGDDNLPTGWGLLHPVPRGNTFESFVVAPQAVQSPARRGLLSCGSRVTAGLGYQH